MVHRHYIVNLAILIGVFVLGYFSLMGIHLFFETIKEKFDKAIHNEQARYRIGERIIAHIGSVESHYYKMATLGAQTGIERIRKDIFNETQAIRQLLDILEHGGTVDMEVGLNLPDIEVTKEVITYVRPPDKRSSIEFIDLSPKLASLEAKIDELAHFVIKRESQDNAEQTEQEIVIFLKQLPTHFIRMKENAARLLYESRQEMLHVKRQSEMEKAFYEKVQYAVASSVILLIIILGTLLARGILKTNRELLKSNKNAKALAFKAQMADRAKSQFLANMSHEIRTPLNGIIGFANILMQSALTVQNREYARIIYENSHALLDIINDILDFSKVEQGSVEILQEPFATESLLERVVELFAIKAKEKSIRFYFYASPTIPELLIGDIVRLRQVLSNLLGNAIKFTPNGGKVYFEVRQLSINEESVTLRFSIEDSGIGISQEQKEKIFEPFVQADEGISRRFGGTGLGLSISSDIIEKMGSRIELESDVGKGSKFYFDLCLPIGGCSVASYEKKSNRRFAILGTPSEFPELLEVLQVYLTKWGELQAWSPDVQFDALFCYITTLGIEEKMVAYKKQFPETLIIALRDDCLLELPSSFKPMVDHFIECPLYGSKIFNTIASLFKKEGEESVSHEKSVSLGYKILVAEDNPTNRQLMEIYLDKLGVMYTMVENGERAVEAYKSEKFDAILMDINMPVMDGLAATEAILRQEKEEQRAHIPIIALTANTLKGDKERYEQMGMDGYLSKPVDFKELKLYFENLLNVEHEGVIVSEPLSIPTKESIALKMGLDILTVEMILDNFFLTLEDDLQKLEIAHKNQDEQTVKTMAHYLKGASANLFLEKAVELLESIESQPLGSQEAVQKLRNYFNALSQ